MADAACGENAPHQHLANLRRTGDFLTVRGAAIGAGDGGSALRDGWHEVMIYCNTLKDGKSSAFDAEPFFIIALIIVFQLDFRLLTSALLTGEFNDLIHDIISALFVLHHITKWLLCQLSMDYQAY